MDQDQSHLKNLEIAHYVVGGIMVLFSCMPLIHLFIGLAFIVGGESMFPESGEEPPAFVGWLFFTMGLVFFLVGQAVSVSVIISGRFLNKRKNYLFSFVLACIVCLFVPLGTALGVFTIIILSRDSVKAIYGRDVPVNPAPTVNPSQ